MLFTECECAVVSACLSYCHALYYNFKPSIYKVLKDAEPVDFSGFGAVKIYLYGRDIDASQHVLLRDSLCITPQLEF